MWYDGHYEVSTLANLASGGVTGGARAVKLRLAGLAEVAAVGRDLLDPGLAGAQVRDTLRLFQADVQDVGFRIVVEPELGRGEFANLPCERRAAAGYRSNRS